jgi:hypothetical protein
MSCEVLCLEVPEILDSIINSSHKFILKMFSFLKNPKPLDNYRAGYFEKILEMLFRKETEIMMSTINENGISLFQMFLNHIDNYSIMQLVQRLMLPHIPFTIVNDAEETDSVSYTPCLWSSTEQICSLLCTSMLQSKLPDTSSHISDLLITVIQLSPPDSFVISNLCKTPILKELLASAFPFEETPVAITASLPSITVLESLVSRLGETLGLEIDSNVNKDTLQGLKYCIESVSIEVSKYFSSIGTSLRCSLVDAKSKASPFQSKTARCMLGNRALQIVKLVESLVRLNNPALEEKLCQSEILAVILDLIFVFDHNSLLHLSAQRILVSVIEGGSMRRSGLFFHP